jgi:uncharacterized protein
MAPLEDLLAGLTGFEWDAGNVDKSQHKHGVSPAEAEQALLNRPVVVSEDESHSRREARYRALGRTDRGRSLFVVFTVRESRVRVISARSMSRGEQRRYAEAQAQADS